MLVFDEKKFDELNSIPGYIFLVTVCSVGSFETRLQGAGYIMVCGGELQHPEVKWVELFLDGTNH